MRVPKAGAGSSWGAGGGFGAVRPQTAWLWGAARAPPSRGDQGAACPRPGQHSIAGGAAKGTGEDGEEGRTRAVCSPRDIWGRTDEFGVLGDPSQPPPCPAPSQMQAVRGEQQNRGALPPFFHILEDGALLPVGPPNLFFVHEALQGPLCPSSAPSKPVPGVAFRACQSLL